MSDWLGLAVLTLPALLAWMDITVLHLPMPASATDLHRRGRGLAWRTCC